MKLSKETIQVLKNFSLINNSIHIDEKFKLKTKTPNTSNIIGIATIKEELPGLSIYSLDELLGSMSLFEQDEIDFTFTDNYIKMKQDKMKINYRLSDPEYILSKCKESSAYETFNSFDGSFKLNIDQLINIQKAARILKADAVVFEMQDGKGSVNLINSQLPLDNSFELIVQGEGTFKASIFIDNLLIMNSNYNCQIANEKVVKFTNIDTDLYYFISCAIL